MLMRFPFYSLLLAFSLSFGSVIPKWYPPKDEVHIKIDTLYDDQDLIRGYQAYIKTPVCETENCYIVEIYFSWDIIGRFQKFDTLPGAGLTKLDHIPFTEKDYQKLDQLLKDANSPLATYKKEDLVHDTRSSAIDGFTGATARAIKNSVISGGVYSCYTLWHLAHGPIVDSLQLMTYHQLDTALMEKIVDAQDQEMNYFLLEHFSEQDYAQYLPQILTTIAQGNGHYAKQAIQQIPAKVLEKTMAQEFFAEHFKHMNYFAQVALLSKLSPETISAPMTDSLRNQLGTRNSSKNQLIRELLGL